jgi:phage tail sheath gpL-like
MATFSLTGIDASNPRPGFRREVRTNQGPSGGVAQARDCVILCNKVAGTGSASLDGLGDAVNTPIRIGGGTAEVISRFGLHSEALRLANTFWQYNGTTSQLYIQCVPLGAGSAATKDVTFATNTSAVGIIRVESHGDSFEVGVAAGETPTAVALRVSNAINAKDDWLFSCTPVAGVLTVNASMVGGRYDHYVTKLRIRFVSTNAMTITHGAVTTGGADDDQTNAVLALNNYPIYYQVNPKSVVAGVTSTDNGIGEHAAAIADWISPSQNKDIVLITGQVGSVAESGTVAASLNKFNIRHVCARGNDYSPGMLAAAYAGTVARAEAADRAPNLIDYGISAASDKFYVPDPFTKTDRYSDSEITTLLNTGCIPIGFTGTGKSYIIWDISTQHLTNALADYRARPGHIASATFDFGASLQSAYMATKQPKYAADPAPGEKPIPGFTYPRDIRALVVGVIDQKIRQQPATLDPGMRQYMVDSIRVEDGPGGFPMCTVDLKVVKHLTKFHVLLNETSEAR